MTVQLRLAALLGMAMLFAFPAAAQTSKAGATERPWARGVPAAKQEKALALFRDGNVALKDADFTKAAEIYREALRLWDHPAIHYNLVLALVNLDQPLETQAHLLSALKYGAAPLDADKYQQALRYKALIEKQLTTVEIQCQTEGAVVTLDGTQVLVGPGHFKKVVRAGTHTVAAAKEGHVPFAQTEPLVGGTTQRFDIALNLEKVQVTEYRRPFPTAVPWVLAGVGAAVAAGGVGLHLAARSTFTAYDQGIAGCVQPATQGCMPSSQLQAQKQRGALFQTLAMAAYGVGGAAFVAGVVWGLLNQPEPFVSTVEVTPQATWIPLLNPTAPGVGLVVTF